MSHSSNILEWHLCNSTTYWRWHLLLYPRRRQAAPQYQLRSIW